MAVRKTVGETTTKPVKKEDAMPAPVVAVITPSIDRALLAWHDDLKKRGKVEVAANLLAAYNELKTPTAQAVVDAIVNGGLSAKEIVGIAQGIFSVLK